MMIKFSVQTEPVSFKRPRQCGRHRFNDRNYTDYKYFVRLHAQKAMDGRAPFTDAVKISVTIVTKYEPTSLKAGDVDNHLKAILDSLNGICFVDDRQVVEGHVFMFKGTPHVEIEIVGER